MAVTRTIDIRTEIPGPRSRDLLARGDEAIAKPLQVYLPVFAAEALNATITDVDGNVFIDFAGGVGVCNVGHCHPRVVEAIQEQAARFVHTDFTVVPYGVYVELAERLGALVPIAGPTRAAFFNSGAEAVENAVKIARLRTGRPAVLAFEGGFHGRTHARDDDDLEGAPVQDRDGPVRAGGLPRPVPERVPRRLGRGGAGRRSSACSRHTSRRRTSPRSSSSRSSARAASSPLRPSSCGACAPSAIARGSCMVADEVQTGFGRTGRMFAMEHYGVEPDLIVVAKSIAAGLPLSGVVGKAAIMDAPHSGAIGGTFIGNPVALAAALAVLDVFAEEDLVTRATTIGETIRARMHGWQERWPRIGDVRGLGAMLAIELVHDPATKEPAPELARAVIDAALERGLILLKAGTAGNCIRVLCPLTIEEPVLEEALGTWEDALVAVLGA